MHHKKFIAAFSMFCLLNVALVWGEEGGKRIQGGGSTIVTGGTGAPEFNPVITKLGFHHTVRVGRVLHHIFSVATESMFFRLNLDTETLSWTLEEVSDGLAA